MLLRPRVSFWAGYALAISIKFGIWAERAEREEKNRLRGLLGGLPALQECSNGHKEVVYVWRVLSML